MLKRIAVNQLRIGMHIHELCGSWLEHPFWKSGFLLDSSRDLQRIRQCGIPDVWIDTRRGLDLPAALQALETETEPAALPLKVPQALPVEPRADLEQEVARAKKLCGLSKAAVVNLFRQARLGQAIDTEKVGVLVAAISASLSRHPVALISLARLKTADEYTYMHSVAVCALMIALARQLQLGEEQVQHAGLAGLLHDIGKMRIPDAILNKPGKLTDAEFTTMREHPLAGERILLASQDVAALVMDVCLHHHEKIDGSGYPHGLSGEQISLFARMGAVCDVYDAVTSDRVYKRGWDPADAVHRMAEWAGHFDPLVFQAFVKTVGIYPVGSLVRLHSGRLAVVIEQNPKSLLMPRVRVFFSTLTHAAIAQQEVDLATTPGGERIVSRESASAWGFNNLNPLWSGLPARTGSYFD